MNKTIYFYINTSTVTNFYRAQKGQILVSWAGVGASLSRILCLEPTQSGRSRFRALVLPEPELPKKVDAPQHFFNQYVHVQKIQYTSRSLKLP